MLMKPMTDTAADTATPASARDTVRLEGVTKRFGAFRALDAASLRVAEGEFVTLLGPSGCGKTTMLNLIAGFLEPDDGAVFINGARVNETPPFRRGIGLVFQNYALFPHMTVGENVGYGLRMRGVPKSEIASRVARALDLVKLDGFADRNPRQLSGGQQQRVALARAFVIEPAVLLLDEPFSALDKNLRGSMQVELKELQARLGITTIFVTHDQSEALSLSDRIVVMSAGQIRQVGDPDTIYRRPVDPFVAGFVGEVNRIRATCISCADGEARLSIGGAEGSARAPTALAPGSETVLFIRPDQLHLQPAAPEGLSGSVVTAVYQGSHVDLHLDIPSAVDGRVMVRANGAEGGTPWPVGSRAGIVFSGSEAVAFAAEACA